MIPLESGGLVNVETIKFLRRILNPNGLQNFLDKIGFHVDILPYLEKRIFEAAKNNNSNLELTGLIKWIKNNPVDFFTSPDLAQLTRRINNDLLLDPFYINLFGWSIPLYSDPYHMRLYAMYGLGAFVVYKLLFGKKKK